MLILIAGLFWPRKKVADEKTNTNEIPLQSKHQISEKKPVADLSSPPLLSIKKPNGISEDSCAGRVMAEMAKECDMQCLTNNLRDSRSPLVNFIDDGWFDKTKAPSEQQKTKLGKFYFALASAGLLDGQLFPIEKNTEKAMSIMNELIHQEPGNAALYIFAAAIAYREGLPEVGEVYFNELQNNADYYNSYVREFNREILKHSLDNPKTYVASLGLRGNMPIPNFVEISELKKKGFDQNNVAAQWMIAAGLQSKGAYMEVEWMPIEYAAGWKMMNPDPAHPAQPYPKFRELLEHKDASSEARFYTLELGPPDCDLYLAKQKMESELESFKKEIYPVLNSNRLW